MLFQASYRNSFCSFSTSDGPAGKLGVTRGETLVGVVASQGNRNDRGADHFRKVRRKVTQSFFEYLAVVDLGAKDYLSMDLDVVIEQPLELIKDVCAFFIDP